MHSDEIKEQLKIKFDVICNSCSEQLRHYDKELDPKQWSKLFLSGMRVALKGKSRIMPGLEGEYVLFHRAEDELTAQELSDLVEYALAHAILNDVTLPTKDH